MHKGWPIFNLLRRLCLLLTGFLLLNVVFRCRQEVKPEVLHLNGSTMGTTWSASLVAGSGGTEAEALQQSLQSRLDQINGLMSTYDPASELSRFNSQASTDWFAISEETARVIDLSLEISRMTGGSFDISVGPLVELWGFGATLRKESIPSEREVDQALARVGYQNIQVRLDPPAVRKQVPALRIDLSAIAKGYAVDALAELLREQGCKDFLVEIGGELKASGQRGDGSFWRIAIEKPLEDRREVGKVFVLTDIALATSGNYRNFYLEDGQRYVHTLDPVTGRPVRNRLASVTVLDQACARADALATALMVMGEEKARRFCEEHDLAAYFFIHEKTSLAIYASRAFRGLAKEVEQ